MNIPEMRELRVMYDDYVKNIINRALKLGFKLTDPDYELGYKLGIHPHRFESVLKCYDLLNGMIRADLKWDLNFYFWCEGFLRMEYEDWYKEDHQESVCDGTYWP